MLRSRESRCEGTLDDHTPTPIGSRVSETDPEHEAELADSIGLALLVVLQTLPPAERVAFVLHDVFELPFEEIAPIVGRSATATRQLASRERRRVRGGNAARDDVNLEAQRNVVEAFLAASRGGNLNALLAVLDPDVLFRADHTVVRFCATSELHGAAVVAQNFLGRAQAARPALVNGAVGALVAPNGRLFLVLRLTIEGGRIVEIDAVADPEQLRRLDLGVLNI